MQDQRKGAYPCVRAMKRMAKSTIQEILYGASCAVSWDGCVFVMVARFTPPEVVSGIWMVCNQDVVPLPFLIITLPPNNMRFFDHVGWVPRRGHRNCGG